MIKYILFDLDGTIFDFKAAEREAISSTLSSFGVIIIDDIIKRYSEINDSCWKALERGEIARQELIYRRFELLSQEFSLELVPKSVQERYEKELSARYIFIDGAETVLTDISKKFKLYAVTNGNAKVQRARIEKAELDRFFKAYFISEEVDFAKPDKRFFEVVFEKIPGFVPEEAIVIGDSLSSDILGARNAGLKSIYYNPEKHENNTGIIPDYEIAKIEDIKEILSRI